MSGVVEKVKAKVENVLHKNDSTHTGTTGTHATGTHTTGTHAAGTHGHGHSTNAGPHDSNIGNKVDPRVDSDRDGSRNAGGASYGPGGHTTGSGIGGTQGYGSSTNAGPHDSNIANKVDPRVDSDRDGSRNAGASSYGPGGNQTSSHTGAGLTGTGAHTGTHTGSNTAGPHNSDMLNKMDPRVDSDRDGSRNMGSGTHSGAAGYQGTGYSGTTTAGPHDSNLLNKADPRVDSDRDGSRNAGAANYGPGGERTGGTGYGTGTGLSGTSAQNAGPHNSSMLNKADPRVDSDRDGSRNMGAASHGAHTGTGPAHGTAGPHSSNLANKLDPRVDSDLDGSRTAGGNQTYGGTGGNQTY